METLNKKITLGFFIVFVAIILFLNISHKGEFIKSVKIAGQNLKVDLALVPAEQQQGLSGRPALSSNAGMLFIFPQPGKYNFWMKDMNFPIDMIWISEDSHIIYIKNNATPELYPESFGPNEDAKYVLEVVSGFSNKNNLKVGDSISFAY